MSNKWKQGHPAKEGLYLVAAHEKGDPSSRTVDTLYWLGDKWADPRGDILNRYEVTHWMERPEHPWSRRSKEATMGKAEHPADELTRLVTKRTGIPGSKLYCPREKSDMTPCVARDGWCASTDSLLCVGCGHKVLELLAEERAKHGMTDPTGD